ncbi:hypothetical protein [uncultured Aliiroseovarius sp.]|nr:hypothetical protein [uncultured Aliiroseovarius sp.]
MAGLNARQQLADLTLPLFHDHHTLDITKATDEVIGLINDAADI